MKASQSGDGNHEKAEITGSNGITITHVKTTDTKNAGEMIVTSTTDEEGNQLGHTTVHGNNHTNYHGTHIPKTDPDK